MNKREEMAAMAQKLTTYYMSETNKVLQQKLMMVMSYLKDAIEIMDAIEEEKK